MTNKKHTTYEICCFIRNTILTRTASCIVYDKHWGREYQLEQIHDIVNRVEKTDNYTKPNLSELTEYEMKELGFVKWSDDNPVSLIPLWLYPFLPDEIELGCIDGVKQTKKKSDIDTDHRFGCLAYGIMPVDGGDKKRRIRL